MKRTWVVSWLAGCATSGSDDALMAAISGEEEDFVARSYVDPETADRPPLFRDCDALGELESREEGGDASYGPPGPHDGPIGGHDPRRDLLGLVYDHDVDHTLDDDEEATLLADFDARCEAIHARLVATYDADGDGELSEDEKDVARAALEAEREARMEEMEEARGEMECDRDGPPPEGEPMVPPMLMEEFDADGDGTLSDTEIATLRETMRARIRNGDPLAPPPE